MYGVGPVTPMNTINPSVSNHLYMPKAQPAVPVREDNRGAEAADAFGGSEPEAKAKGVMRLIENGHFAGKGVADVRLRINFHEQLQSLDNAKAQEATRQALGELKQFVSDTIQAFSANLTDGLPEAVQTFQDVINELDGDAADIDSTGIAVREAFAWVVGSLSAEEPADPETAPDHESNSNSETSVSDLTAGVSTPLEEELDFSAEALISALETGLKNFEASLASATEAHQFVRPNGNGKAFDKFLEVYESLSAGDVQPDDEKSAVLLDQTA